MCGRFSLDTTKSEIVKEFKCDYVAFKQSSFNIAPIFSKIEARRIQTFAKQAENGAARLRKYLLDQMWVIHQQITSA